MVMIDGAAFGGFNVVDIRALSRKLDVPVVTVSRDNRTSVAIEMHSSSHFPDWERRLGIISRNQVRPVQLPDGRVFVTS